MAWVSLSLHLLGHVSISQFLYTPAFVIIKRYERLSSFKCTKMTRLAMPHNCSLVFGMFCNNSVKIKCQAHYYSLGSIWVYVVFL